MKIPWMTQWKLHKGFFMGSFLPWNIHGILSWAMNEWVFMGLSSKQHMNNPWSTAHENSIKNLWNNLMGLPIIFMGTKSWMFHGLFMGRSHENSLVHGPWNFSWFSMGASLYMIIQWKLFHGLFHGLFIIIIGVSWLSLQ